MRGLVNRDLVRHNEPVRDATLGERTSVIETEQTGSGRVLFHDDRHIVQAFPEGRWNAAQRAFYDFVKVFGPHAIG